MLPKKGVYAVSMEIGPESKIYRGVANVGVKPTFHDPAKAEVVIEVNILILMKIFMANELLCIGTIS